MVFPKISYLIKMRHFTSRFTWCLLKCL